MRLFLLAILAILIVPLVAHAQPTRPVLISAAEITAVGASGGICSVGGRQVNILITPESPDASVSVACGGGGSGPYVDITFELSENAILVDVELAAAVQFEATITVDVPQAGAALPIVVRSDSGSLHHPSRVDGIIGGTYPMPVFSWSLLAPAITVFVLPGDRVTFFDGYYYFDSPVGSVNFSTLPEQVPEISQDEFDGLSGDVDSLSGEVESLGSEVDGVDTRIDAIEALPMIKKKLEP